MNSITLKNKSIIILQSLFFTATLFAANCTFASQIITQSNQKQLNQLRWELWMSDVNERNINQYPSITILEKQPKGIRYGNCHNYAISTLLGLKGRIPENIPLAEGQDWYTEFNFLGNYCKKVSTPKQRDLVVYRLAGHSEIEHTGIYHEDGTVESKWGGLRRIYKAPTFHIPIKYGNCVKYYRINRPIDKIIKDMKKKVSQPNYQKKCAQLNRMMVIDAEQSHNFIVWTFLEYNMCANVNATNDKDETLLMIAKKNNNSRLEKMLLKYEPTIDNKNNKI